MESKTVYELLPKLPKSIYPSWELSKHIEDSCECQLQGQGWEGALSWYSGSCHQDPDAHRFICDQYVRFGLRPPIDYLIDWCWGFVYHYIDVMDPSILFSGCTDVVQTEENYFYQYSFKTNGGGWSEADPGEVETYRYFPEGIKAWEILMSYPGLQHYFDYLDNYFTEHWDMIQPEYSNSYPEEHKLIQYYGVKLTKDLAHLGVWASIMWICSPMAREWRTKRHPIFSMCYEYGEGVLYEWCFYSKEYYQKLNRPAQSCVSCHSVEWCVELTQFADGPSQYICEHCLNPVTHSYATCGTRLCKKASCPHHPGAHAARMIGADERYGSIRMLPDGRKVRDLPGLMYIQEQVATRYAKGITDIIGQDFRKLLGI